MLSKGTVGDKIAAHTVLIQENPVGNLENIRNLVGMVKVGKKKECMEVMGKEVDRMIIFKNTFLVYRHYQHANIC